MKHTIRWAPVILMMAIIFFFSSRTGDQLNTVLPLFQWIVPSMTGFNWGHFIAYFLLAVTFLWAFREKRPSFKTRAIVIALCLVYGMTDEFHQIYVPGRDSDWHDLRNDGIGASLAMLVLYIPAIQKLYSKLPHAKKY